MYLLRSLLKAELRDLLGTKELQISQGFTMTVLSIILLAGGRLSEGDPMRHPTVPKTTPFNPGWHHISSSRDIAINNQLNSPAHTSRSQHRGQAHISASRNLFAQSPKSRLQDFCKVHAGNRPDCRTHNTRSRLLKEASLVKRSMLSFLHTTFA